MRRKSDVLTYRLLPWLAVGLSLAFAGPATAQAVVDIVATRQLLMGCRLLVENSPDGDMMQMGACAGAVSAALDIGHSIGRVCQPEGAGVPDAARIVISFVEERPKRASERFGPLTVTALGYRWPC